MSRQSELAELSRIYDSSALSNRNLVINGAMQVAQRGTSSTGLGASSGYFTVDRINPNFNATAGRLTMTQETITDLTGFSNCVKLACTTADTSIAAAEYLILTLQAIEGQNLQHLAKGTSAAKKVTVSFYVKANAAATYVCELQDSNSREISKSFSVTTDWTRVVLTYDGDTSGTLPNTNARGMSIQLWLHAGSNFNSGSAGDLNTSWSAAGTGGVRAAGIDSFFDSTSRTFFITGVQMEVGTEATPFEHRSFGDELRSCQRYYVQSKRSAYASIFGGAGWANTTGSWIGKGQIPVPMRAAPTVVYSGTARVQNGQVGYNLTSLSASLIGDNLTTLSMGGNASGLTLYNPLDVDAGASTATFDLDAEL